MYNAGRTYSLEVYLENLFVNRDLVHLTTHPEVLIMHPHAQRTGGGTLRNSVLAAGFGRECVYSRMFVADFRHWPQLKEADLRGYRAYTDLSNYCELPLSRPCLPIALLRDPIYRAVSLYHFVRRKNTHELHSLAMNSSLTDFYRAGSRINPRYFRNVQTARVCGRPDARMALAYILTRYLAVGFTEKVDEMAQTLARMFSWPNVHVQRRMPGPIQYEAQITPTFRDMVLSQNEEDVALFEAMSRGPPYIIPKRQIHQKVAIGAKRLRDDGLALTRRVQRRFSRMIG